MIPHRRAVAFLLILFTGLEDRWSCTGTRRNALKSGVEIRVLGPLEVVDDGRFIELPSAKARLLLAALVVHANEVVSTDRLFEVLWGARPPESAANTLQTYVAHLRTALEPDRARRKAGQVLVTRQPGYMLAIEPGAIDAVRFERLAEQGRRELATAPADAVRTLRAALALWRGEALSDFTYEPFTQADITRLTELRFAALEDRIGADLSLGEHHAVVGELAQLVGEHPFRERLAGQFMVALYRDGRQADALRAYRRLRDTLVEQLGIEPNPTVSRLERAILQQRPDLDWSPLEAAPVPDAVPARPAPSVSGEHAAARGRAAAAERRWQDALEYLSIADHDDGLRGDDLDMLADALLWTGQPLEALAVRQRAHAALVEEGNIPRAAMVAVMLAIWFGARLRISVAGGWFQRARRLLENEAQRAEHGFLEWAATMFAIATGRHEDARESAQRAFDVGQRFGVPDLQAMGLTFGGYVRVRQGEVAQGMPMIDEGMTWAVSGQVSPLAAQMVFCRTISTCYELGDYRRAAEWMDAIAECSIRAGIDSLPGDCETHSIAILIGLGAWSEAERRARYACAGMEPIELAHVGQALAEIGEIHLRMGDLDGAADALAKATENAAPPQPSTALLLLARGDPAGAAASIGAALAEAGWNNLARARLLPAQVEIALASEDLATARSAVTELAGLADAFASPAIRAAADTAQGAVLLADGDAAGAVQCLRRSADLWRDANAPYERARARALLARALHARGERSHAQGELQAARSAFESLGARLDLAHLPAFDPGRPS
jgi:DNA-binding SARP family transcriptional activator/HEPN domain-containing protein